MEIAQEGESEHIDFARNLIIRSKILHHFIKGKISLSPMETILVIPSELESLESLVKLIRKKCDEGLKTINLTKVEGSHAIQIIIINKNYRSKMLHLLVEISNNLIKRLVDTGASMSIMSTTFVRELGIMHLVSSSESYMIASCHLTQALCRISELLVRIGDVQCMMNFMVVDTNSYDILLGLDFFIKMGVVVDVKKGMI
jgi:hypothetical protein